MGLFTASGSRRSRRSLLFSIVTMLVMVTALSRADGGRRPFWWRSAVVQARLGLTPAQVKQIDELYERSLPDRRVLRSELANSQERLSRAIADGARDDSQTRQLIERVVDAERRSNVARTMLLVRIYGVLTPGQRVALDGLVR